MTAACLQQEISEIQANAEQQTGAEESHLEKLFTVFRKIEDLLANCNKQDEEDEAKASGLIDAQTVVMRTAAVLPARSMSDLLYKLAMWRWDAPDLDQPIDQMNRKNAVAYSAFRDLAKMLDADDVLKDFDKAN